MLVTHRPEATTALLMQLCTPGERDSDWVTQVADFAHIYSERCIAGTRESSLLWASSKTTMHRTTGPGMQMSPAQARNSPSIKCRYVQMLASRPGQTRPHLARRKPSMVASLQLTAAPCDLHPT